MKVTDHPECLKTNPRYAELINSAQEKYKAMDEALDRLEKEFPVHNGFYCRWGDYSVRPTYRSSDDDWT